MVDSFGTKVLRVNVYIAFVVSIVCGAIAMFISSTDSNSFDTNTKHVEKESWAFNSTDKYIISRFLGDEFPNSSYLQKFSEFNLNAVLIDFPGVENITSEWETNFTNFVKDISNYKVKFSFYLKNVKERNATDILADINYVQDHCVSDSYFELTKGPFIAFEINKKTINMHDVLLKTSQRPIYPCAIIDDRDDIRKGYQEGMSCFISSSGSDSYFWSANPKAWENLNSVAKGLSSVFVPVVQNVYRAAESRKYDHYDRYEEEEVYLNDMRESEEIPEGMDMREAMEREEKRRIEMEKKRKERMERRAIEEAKSDFAYAWDFAKVLTNVIAIQACNNTNWLFSDSANFTDSVMNLTTEFRM